MTYAHQYLAAVLERSRNDMPPIGFEPNWSDAPRLTKWYRGAEMLPLPLRAAPSPGTLADGLQPPPADGGGEFDLDSLAGMLRYSYGYLSQRLAVTANEVSTARKRRDGAWGRGTASGGGRYPVSIYWVSGPTGPLAPGVYYYATGQHAMQCLLTGDVSGEVRAAAQLPPPAGDTDQFLVLGIKFWQNSFKYNNFGYHATTMDIGTLVQTWRIWARAAGLAVEPAFWFDEPAVGRLLGVRAEDEGIFAVVPLRWRRPADRRDRPTAGGTPLGVRFADSERSREVLTFDMLSKVHEDTLGQAADRPAGDLLAGAGVAPHHDGPQTVLPPALPLDVEVRDALTARRSSFGRFCGRPSMSPEQLATILTAATAGGRLPCDVNPDQRGPDLTKLYVFVNHVEGITAGGYEYVPDRNALVSVAPGDHGEFLQRNYFLDNYNLEQAAAVITVVARATAVMDAVGARGYRVVNAVTGAVAQTVYLTCAALGLGCGAALGFDNLSYIEELKLDGTDEVPLLILMTGGERGGQATFACEIG